MEILILVCLIIVIILLLKDKVVIYKTVRKQVRQKNRMSDLPDIMGLSKPIERHTVPMNTTKSQSDERSDIPDTFETETYETGFEWKNPQREEELDEVFGSMLDFEDEEEEWSEYEYTNSDNEFATGVTFDELTTVGALLQQEVLEPALQQKAVNIVQRLQGTELFSLLENSMEGASQKIAALLDKSLSTETDFSSSNLRKNDVGDFDIGEFI
ncbi:conjugal transfer protein TraD [Myroides odoratimimus]|uniref:conjugal transfer protein TraD n=1 Tax=Myroides odoratimimus TaxID=76832 RepID=UPI00217FC8AA|nr:conjugal transfer protein TraD [Myroides odoratimimus]MCS7474391.1 conjugal transfer protein TraD [Myroides odoratimimus]MDM1086665.1 conjugal transfer protein TraD [Myroides odoratimimus]MDM1512977.1 conjugal transfer protein TraD [Myroides odoratimimus]